MTFVFRLAIRRIFLGTGMVGIQYLTVVGSSGRIILNKDTNALTLPAIKSDNPVIIQPLGILLTVIR